MPWLLVELSCGLVVEVIESFGGSPVGKVDGSGSGLAVGVASLAMASEVWCRSDPAVLETILPGDAPATAAPVMTVALTIAAWRIRFPLLNRLIELDMPATPLMQVSLTLRDHSALISHDRT